MGIDLVDGLHQFRIFGFGDDRHDDVLVVFGVAAFTGQDGRSAIHFFLDVVIDGIGFVSNDHEA